MLLTIFFLLFLLIIIGIIITFIIIKLIEYNHKQRKKPLIKRSIICDDVELKIINSDEIC